MKEIANNMTEISDLAFTYNFKQDEEFFNTQIECEPGFMPNVLDF